MTGEEYVRLPRGPGPKDFDRAVEELVQEDKISKKRVDFDENAYQYRYNSLKEPEINILSSEELEVIDSVISRCSRMSAGQISDYSHEDLPWQATEDLEPIDYELVFYRTPEFSVRNYE